MDLAVRRRLPRLAAALAVAAGFAAFFWLGPSEREILQRQADWKAYIADNLFQALCVFFVAEVILVGLSVPVASGLSLLAGVLFGRWLGTLVVSISSTIGALIATLIARYIFHDSIRRRIDHRPRWQAAMTALDRGVEKEGWFYLLLIRLTPVLPFFMVNVLMGLTRMRPWTYTWTTQLGMLPSTFLVVSAGAEVGEIESFRDLSNLQRLWPLLVLAVVPIGLRLLAGRYLRRHPEENPASEL